MRYRALTAISDKTPEEIDADLETCRDFSKKTRAEQDNLRDYWRKWLQSPTAIIVRADQLTEAQKREFIIKDNVSFGEWEDSILTADFSDEELIDWGLNDLSDDDEADEDADEDEYSEEDAANAPTRCNPGDVWLLGRHRLMCGDSTKEADVAIRLRDCIL